MNFKIRKTKSKLRNSQNKCTVALKTIKNH